VLADVKAGAPFPPNTMLDEKYRLDQLLEVGGMGAVYLGTHTRLQKQVAIKVLRRELAEMPDMIERFQREAVSASRIGHENIVNVSDLGTAQDGSPFLVMEYLTGQTLRERIRECGALPIGLACAITREILAAIAAAHEAGIIHRDLKPENVFLVRGTRGESIKILDFGISRVVEARGVEAAEWRLTATGQVMGTPYYMAPEQAAGRSDIGGAVDVYAAGVILYEMLSGVVPFAAGNYNTIIYKVLAGEYEPLSSRLGGLPVELEAAVHRAMSLEPEARFASADEFAAAVEPFSPGATSSSQRVPLMTDPLASGPRLGFAPTVTPPSQWRSVAGGTVEVATTPDRPPRRRRRWLGALIVVPVLAAGIATALLLVEPGGGDAGRAGQAAGAAGHESEPPGTGEPAARVAMPAPAALPAAAATPVPAAATPAPAETAPASGEARVLIRFEVEPADAAITVDGAPLEGAELAAPRSRRDVEVAVTRDGYKAKTRRVSLAESRTVEVILEKAPDRRRPRRGRSREPRKRGDAREGTSREGERIINDSPYD
jgi:serine/threonine-protein kinase